MDSGRASRRKSKICYKEDDSFTEEFVSPIRPPPKHTYSTTLVNVKETTSWNPMVNIDKVREDNVTLTSPRRGTRVRHKTAVSKEAEESCSLMKKLSVKNNRDDEQDETSDSDVEPMEKPSDALFCDEDVQGKDMFKFKGIHKRESMIKKAIESVLESPKLKHSNNDSVSKGSRTPKTPKSTQKTKLGTPVGKSRRSLIPTTPKSGKLSNAVEKTPHHVRIKMKKKLQTITFNDISDGSDFEDSGSDFQPSSDDSSSNEDVSDSQSEKDDTEKSSDSEMEMEEEPQKPKPKQTLVKTKSYSLRNTKLDKDDQYVMKSDNYFTMQSSKKVVTSNHTLDRLKTPRLSEDKLQTILSQQKLSKEHRNAIEELVEDHERLFDKWMYTLSEGFNILLHGIGSKYKLIQDFQIQKLKDHPCVVINGFFPSLTLKDILEIIIIDLLELNSVPSNAYDAVRLIDNEMSNLVGLRLFLLIHNIDGAMLKNNKTQAVLSKLTKIKNIHLVASVDHINAPLVWDHSIIRNFNFSWWDATTLLPYTKETSFESSLMVHRSGALALSSLKNVFQSLTTNARGIFMIIVKNQLKNKKTPHYQGISFKDLYWSSREAFLVSSDQALRAQLTEFLDHKLAKTKRTANGIENLIIPIDNSLLQQFLDENDN